MCRNDGALRHVLSKLSPRDWRLPKLRWLARKWLARRSSAKVAVRAELQTVARGINHPAYCMNGIKGEEFVMAVSGHALSVRKVEQLAHGVFRGPESFWQEIRQGNLALPLERMRQVPQGANACSEFERMSGAVPNSWGLLRRASGPTSAPGQA